jgi:hypothetical protein
MHTVNHIEERVMAKEKIWTSRRKKYIYQRVYSMWNSEEMILPGKE